MKENKPKITLHLQTAYRIEVTGVLDSRWEEWFGNLELSAEDSGRGWSITTITGIFDQAALHSLLRRLYGHGVPLISVTCQTEE